MARDSLPALICGLLTAHHATDGKEQREREDVPERVDRRRSL